MIKDIPMNGLRRNDDALKTNAGTSSPAPLRLWQRGVPLRKILYK